MTLPPPVDCGWAWPGCFRQWTTRCLLGKDGKQRDAILGLFSFDAHFYAKVTVNAKPDMQPLHATTQLMYFCVPLPCDRYSPLSVTMMAWAICSVCAIMLQ